MWQCGCIVLLKPLEGCSLMVRSVMLIVATSPTLQSAHASGLRNLVGITLFPVGSKRQRTRVSCVYKQVHVDPCLIQCALCT